MFERASDGAEPTILKLAVFNMTVLVLTCNGADQNVYCDVPALTFANVTVFALKLVVAMLPTTTDIILPITFELVTTPLPVKLVTVTAMLEAELAAVEATSAFTEMVFDPFTAMERPFIVVCPETLKE